MISRLSSIAVTLCFALLVPIAASAAPGDPRFLQGIVEWPVALTGEPIVIVRGDDGRVYSADVAGARRQGAEVVRIGGRVALLVLQGDRPHEVTAIVIGSGDAVSLSRALAQGGLPAPAPSPAPVLTIPPSLPAVAPLPVPAPAVSAPPTPTPAAATVPAPPAAAVTPPPPPAAAPGPAPAPSPPAIVATPPPVPTPAPAVTAPAASPTVVVMPPVATTPSAAPAPPAATPSAPPAPAAVAPPPAPASPSKATALSIDRKQWARLDGRVQSVEGALLVLRADNGSLVMVDISQLNPNVTSALRRERLVSVYGYPLEQKFEAAGYIELDPSQPEPPRVRRR